ncbi:MAG: hypothetical protein M0R73_06715 [Dehalococcoidia bacterium]|nr:hypothetical protein [Dehalococcoidia bacterium]
MRRATAAGIGGLAAAIFLGVMAFAFTTTPAERTSNADTEANSGAGTVQFLANTTKATELRTLSAMRSLIQEASAVAFGAGGDHTDDGAANEQALLASRDDAEAPTRDGASDGGTFMAAAAAVASRPRPLPAAPPSTAASGTAAQDEAEADDEPDPRVEAAAISPPAGATPVLEPGDRVEATISFYYCEQGERGLHPGDGGRFCGAMRNGQVVHPGAAACAYAYLGQRFRIQGDSLDRVYTCADTGSAVHGLHRDIWFQDSDQGWSWQLGLGQRAVIEIVE